MASQSQGCQFTGKDVLLEEHARGSADYPQAW